MKTPRQRRVVFDSHCERPERYVFSLVLNVASDMFSRKAGGIDCAAEVTQEVTTLWRYTNIFIIIIIFFKSQVVKIPGVKNKKN